MKSRKSVFQWMLSFLLLSMLLACTQVTPPPPDKEAATAPPAKADEDGGQKEGQLPVRYQQPAYLLGEKSADDALGIAKGGSIAVPVGADISSTAGPVALRDILKRLTSLKGMNVSWGSDVDQFALVDFDIKAEDDFFEALDNILRQLEYFHEVQGNTVVVKFRDTRKFHIAMPFLTSNYNTGVGGNVLGASGEAQSTVVGNIQITSEKNTFDVWSNIQGNLDQILDVWDETAPMTTEMAASSTRQAGESKTDDQEKTKVSAVRVKNKNAKGYYTIDKPVGLITVSAPKPLLEKITVYIDNLKKELYRQVSIEAKIVEVTLSEGSRTGVNWTKIFSIVGEQGIDFNFELFGDGTGGTLSRNGLIYPGSNRVVSAISLTNPFTLALEAIEEQGDTRVLANPKISVMNGQPALISVGESVKYIDSVEGESDEGVISYSVKTSSVMSGLGMSVIATVMENNEIILSLTPVTSQLEEPIEYREFGQGNVVGLPKVQLREMNTVVRVKDGDMLMIGGLIDNAEDSTDAKVPVLGDLPLFKSLFKYNNKSNIKRELVILLQPKIIS